MRSSRSFSSAAHRHRRAGGLVGVMIVSAVLGACTGTRPLDRPPDERFGHRFEGKTDDGRETIVITPEDDFVTYMYFPAVYDTVHIRTAPPESADAAGVPVEVLVKGAFPDACTELSSAGQERVGNLISVDLQMRRPKGVLCASVVRPYRFYLMLDGLYEPGHYSLKINDRVHPMVIRPFEG